MSDKHMKLSRFCAQYAKVYEHRVNAKMRELEQLTANINDVHKQLTATQNKLTSINDYTLASIANMMPEVHRVTLNQVSILSKNVLDLELVLSELKQQRSVQEKALCELQLKQKVIDNKSTKHKSEEIHRVNALLDTQLEQLRVINKGAHQHA
ncbi:hypothetical protein [Pseudoalteromonas piscicida]|uniref:hypothetical protein n=1 Tax=Pseudoalteromonas piscicida TaxID=43662 RepID=UPI003C7B2CEE